MELSSGGEGPSILQLHKWSPSQPQFNLSEYREAFISPTRQILLLLSHQCEAFLLPLGTGDSGDSTHLENSHDVNFQSSESLAFSRVSTEVSPLDTEDSTPCASGSKMDMNDDFSLRSKFLRSSRNNFVGDVNSVAWGVCGDMYNKHRDASFREFLFVSGNQGVTVHSFCQPNDSAATSSNKLPVECGQGNWVEWGPSAMLVQNVEQQKPSSNFCDATGNLGESRANGSGERSLFTSDVEENELLSQNTVSKRWLQSFFTRTETIKSDGGIWTRYPEKVSFPCTAPVVSFSIFSNNLHKMNFLCKADSVTNEEVSHGTVLGTSMNSKSTPSGPYIEYGLSNIFGDGVNNLYKCSRVFSSNSHYLVGFVLKLVESVTVDKSDDNGGWSETLLLVARLGRWGIHWVSSVKLDESLTIIPMAEWTDFLLSDDHLVCLNASGFIFLFDAVSGKYVTHVDIVRTNGLNHKLDLKEKTKLPVGDSLHIEQADKACKLSRKDGDYRFQRKFKKLLAASSSSLLAVVDEYGVIYVLCTIDYMIEKYPASERLLPHFQHLGLGTLVSWEVGSSDIGCQRIHSKTSDSFRFDVSQRRDGSISFLHKIDSKGLPKILNSKFNGKSNHRESCLSGFSANLNIKDHKSEDSEPQSFFMRKVFLPSYGSNKDDFIFFSPMGITRFIKQYDKEDQKQFQLVHYDLHVESKVHDDSSLNSQAVLVGEAIGCTFQGCLYLVTDMGLSVVLPSISVSSDFLPFDFIVHRRLGINSETGYRVRENLELKESEQRWPPWKVEVLDRVLLYESIEEADRLCLENGWDLKVARMRRLQMALHYLRFEEIERSLKMLVDVNMEEEGVLAILFATVHLIFLKVGNDNVSVASRILALATSFATSMVRKYGLLQSRQDAYTCKGISRAPILSLSPDRLDKVKNEMQNLRRLREMAHLLESIRNLKGWLSSKIRRPGHGLVEGGEASDLGETELVQDEPQLLSMDVIPLETTTNQYELSFTRDNFALMPSGSKSHLDSEDVNEGSALVPRGVSEESILPLENPKEMITRWKIDNIPIKGVVKDALLSGRLPLAVLQLHIHRLGDLNTEKDTHDTFAEVRDIGRAIAYDLFLKGEIGLAVATLQKLGEDIEISLKQLLLGTLRRSIRSQISEEMKRYGFLGPHDCKILERISLIERHYPSSSFWKTCHSRQREITRVASSSSPSDGYNHESLRFHLINNTVIECGEVDGVVLGPWTSVNEKSSTLEVDEDNAQVGYWAAAAIWLNAWDQKTTDRILLDQYFLMGVDLMWESQLDYQICHNNWDEVSKLIDLIPTSSLLYGSLQISLDGLQPPSVVRCDWESSLYGNYLSSLEELDTVCLGIPGVNMLRLSSSFECTVWLRMIMEEKLARKLVFLKEYWEGTAELMPLLARSGFITSKYSIPLEDDYTNSFLDLKFPDRASHLDTLQALHKVLIHHCVQYNLPFLLDLYLDRHELVLDNDSLGSLQEAAGDCQWARWLLDSRIRGCEYDASFSNARFVMARNSDSGRNLSILEIDEIIRTVDDIAEGVGEMAALATLMCAPIPIQKCMGSGGVSRHHSSSYQCTLENLRPTLQRFPTLRRTLLKSSVGHDITSNFLGAKANNALSEYLSWRDNIFFSAGRDTSLLQMLPYWFPKAVKRLVQLYVQGPLGWQSLSSLPTGEALLHRNVIFFVSDDEHAEVNSISWEATIQKHIEEELYDSPLEETGLGLEHHLHRGRALSAFNYLLAARVQELKSEGQASLALGQSNVQSDLQTLLAPITPSEESLLSSIMPLGIMHFENTMVVASCAFLLELCGLSASMLRVDIAVLRRISSFYKSREYNENLRLISPKGSVFHPVPLESDKIESLARALADEYLHQDRASIGNQKEASSPAISKPPSQALILVLQHLEKASLQPTVDGSSCGSWLLSGTGDGTELRSQQKSASQHWNLVTVFCRMHQLPLSPKYLALLARDNDWVGFLSEAHVGGFNFDTVVQVASKEFSDPRLRTHILTVLKGMQLKKKVGSSSYSDTSERRSGTSFIDENLCIPVELFTILAECEKKKNPGEALLMKAKDLSWSILAMVASCFPDVSPLSCLTVWLEITAARETSSIKVHDIASQIANNVGAAVETTNTLPAGSRILAFHYNRKIPKRRRIIGPMDEESSNAAVFGVSNASESTETFTGSMSFEEEKNSDAGKRTSISNHANEGPESLSKMVAVLCEQKLFLPLLKAFEMFLPSCSLLPFIRALQAFSQMRISEASAHLGSFSARIKEELIHPQANSGGEGSIGASWISSTAIKAADAVLSCCPSPYEKRCLLQLLAGTDFGDEGSAATYYRRLYWKINLAEPLLRKDDVLHLGKETLDDASLLMALEKNGLWEQARTWAKQLEASGGNWKSVVHHVTETQAESMVAEWKEFLWDVPEERDALWSHCQQLFIRHSFPHLQAGLFFLKHAEAVQKDLAARELHELLLLSLQWLSGMITLSNPVYPSHLLRELETKVWLLAVESEAQVKSEGDTNVTTSSWDSATRNSTSIIDQTASVVSRMDNHINTLRNRTLDKHEVRENNHTHNKSQVLDVGFSTTAGGSAKTKRRAKISGPVRRPLEDSIDKSTSADDGFSPFNFRSELQLQDDNLKIETSFSGWEERVGPAELERAVLSLLEFGQITAAKQLQYKLSPDHIPSEFLLVDAALKLAALSTPGGAVSISMLDEDVCSVILSYKILTNQHQVNPLQVLESLVTIFSEGNGRGFCRRVIAIVKAANILGIPFSEAFNKLPIEILQLLSLKAQESFEEANLIVQTHSMPSASIAQILAESFLKGLLAAHRGGYMDSQKEEGPAPLLWRFSDFLKWSELCPSEPEIGHSLMRLVITGQEIPHACEVELLILSHHFYKSSACLDGVDVLVALAATRVEAYVSEGDFPCVARLITGVGNFHALNFILGILIENGQLDLLLQKYSAAADTNPGSAEAVRGFRMAVLTSLKHFNPNDLDALAMVYSHFDMKHETASLLESRAEQSNELWLCRYNWDQNEDLLDSMRYYIEAAEVHSSIDAGNKTRKACAQASLVSLQIRMPDFQWLFLSETNARRALVEQSRFQEALIVAEAYDLNQPSEWALVLWNQMLKPELLEEFVAEFVAALPLHHSMLGDIARFYRSEVAARGDQSQFSFWLTAGGLPADWLKYLGRSFRCLLKRTRDLRFRLQLANVATGFTDVSDACVKALDKVPDNSPLVLRKGHGGGYLPLM